jgi:hypothetical protein
MKVSDIINIRIKNKNNQIIFKKYFKSLLKQ